MFPEMTAIQAILGYVVSGLLFGIFFFGARFLMKEWSGTGFFRLVVGIIAFLISLSFGLICLMFLCVMFAKAFWLTIALIAIVVALAFRFGK